MGIKQLMQLIDEVAPGCYQETEKSSYMGRTIAIDASMQLYACLISIQSSHMGGPQQQLQNEDGKVTSHIVGFFSKTINLLKAGIKPVFVFDGKAPELKLQELTKRKALKEKAQDDLKKAQEELKDSAEGEDKAEAVEAVNKAAKRMTRVTREHNEDAQKLLGLMGLPFVVAPSEAEAQCSELCKKGKCFAVCTEDMDALTFGTPILLRRLMMPEKQALKVLEIHVDKLLALAKLSMDEFIDLCILCGCDYCPSIKGVGPKTAYKLIQEHKTIEKVCAHLESQDKKKPKDKQRYEAPEQMLTNLEAIRTLFKTPEVTDGGSFDFKFEKVQTEALMTFLVTEMGFKEENVKRQLERLQKSKSQTSQKRLESFFTKAPATADSATVGFKRKKTKPKAKGVKRGAKKKTL